MQLIRLREFCGTNNVVIPSATIGNSAIRSDNNISHQIILQQKTSKIRNFLLVFLYHSSSVLFLDHLYFPPLFMNSLWSNPLPSMAALTPMSRIDFVASFLPLLLSRNRMYSSRSRYELRIALLDSGTRHLICL